MAENKIIKYQEKDFELVISMAKKLFSDYEEHLLRRDMTNALKKSSHQCYLALQSNTTAGFAIASIRTDYVEGASGSPTGYLEAIFVEEKFRGFGIAKLLLESCENWAKEKGCTEMGSDTWLKNEEAQKFHEAIGFKEDDRLVHYIKEI